MYTAPRLAAQYDWMTAGSFTPEQYSGNERKEYEDEAARIERQWDNQPN
ncbi:hypothetical protein GCM10009504_40360 [Pseudomonas laurentiana]|nr:hypothetical protein [Pseudomonas laurentiana]GGU79391.1 hypothetical protein GCM10009504_40360 [Pseudomonas laurentiana]